MSGDWYGGQEQQVEALGKVWRLSRQTRHVWREFAAWAREKLPDPIEALARHVDQVSLADARVVRALLAQDAEAQQQAGGVPAVQLAGRYVQLSEALASKAMDKAASYLDFGGPELASLLACPEGQVRMLWLLLRKHHPEADEDAADDAYAELGPYRTAEIFRAASGSLRAKPKNDEAPAVSP